jgi:hypothetical protein
MKPAVQIYPNLGTCNIQHTLELIRHQFNEVLGNAEPRADDWVILSNVTDHKGNVIEETRDKLVMMLVNIQHNPIVRIPQPPIVNPADSIDPPLHLDLFVLFRANFYDRNYLQGLGLISKTISYFQQHPCFTSENLLHLDPNIERLTFQMVNLDLANLRCLKDLVGATYLPSVYYKMQVIPFMSVENQEASNKKRRVANP